MKNYLLAAIICLLSELIYNKSEKKRTKIDNEENKKPVYTQCGITSDWTYNNWAKNIVTTTPTVFPKDDSELKYYLKIIKDNKCKARPVGATHSAGGIVLENKSTDTIAVSLAKSKTTEAFFR